MATLNYCQAQICAAYLTSSMPGYAPAFTMNVFYVFYLLPFKIWSV